MYAIKKLTALHSLPFYTPEGRMVAAPGYDAGTRLWLHLPYDYSPSLPQHPTPGQVQAALVQLMKPFRGYRWASPDDAGAAVCAVLTAIARPVLTLCPAVLFDASTQGSGKTLAARALGALMTGRHEGVTPFAGSDDDELRKRIMAGVVVGQQFHCIDNLVGHVKSPALAGVLTSGRLQDRLLGASKIIDASIRALFTATGNNASLDADLMRRTMRVRIEGGAAPTLRRFDFNPVNEMLSDRLKISEAALTIWRGYFAAGAQRIASDDAGGFVEWSNLCRQPVLWLQREGLAEGLGWGELGDPAASMLADAAEHDPEIEALADMLAALESLAGVDAFSTAEAVSWFEAGEHNRRGDSGRFWAAVRDLTGLREVSSRSLGNTLKNRRDRTAGGWKLLAGPKGRGGVQWRVVPGQA